MFTYSSSHLQSRLVRSYVADGRLRICREFSLYSEENESDLSAFRPDLLERQEDLPSDVSGQVGRSLSGQTLLSLFPRDDSQMREATKLSGIALVVCLVTLLFKVSGTASERSNIIRHIRSSSSSCSR